VFVHGVPETADLWDGVRKELGNVGAVALSLPGFGVPVPDGFGATMDEYAEWLVGEVEQFDAPVDLVGHDWGGLLTGRVVSVRPDVVRSWVSDTMGGFDPEWEWHEVAKVWQTPGEGEQFMETVRALPLEQRADTFTASFGIRRDDALAMLSRQDERMDDCILKLYRSAVGIETKWGSGLGRVPAPGLALVPTEDPFNSEARVRRVAERAGARVVTLDGVNHFWPYQTPERGATVLREFWGTV
jgi:pimeloyl-ACP methyl ester carboxylesterase